MDWGEELKKFHVQLAILFLTLAIYIFTKQNAALNLIFGVALAVEIVGFVILEIKHGVKTHGIKHEIVDTLVALAVALLIWYGASFLLNTSSPISAVASCSMLPNLERGDFVIVQGSEPKAYEITLTKEEFDAFASNTAVITGQSYNETIGDSLFLYCIMNKNELCDAFLANPSAFNETRGPLEFHYSACPIKIEGRNYFQPCVESVSVSSRNYLADFSHDTIVYQPADTDYFARIGDIVHRAMFKINVDGEKYYLSRGDNNPVLDIQMGNSPVSSNRLKGKVLFRIPLIGYFKLFISGQFFEQEQCGTQLSFAHE